MSRHFASKQNEVNLNASTMLIQGIQFKSSAPSLRVHGPAIFDNVQQQILTVDELRFSANVAEGLTAISGPNNSLVFTEYMWQINNAHLPDGLPSLSYQGWVAVNKAVPQTPFDVAGVITSDTEVNVPQLRFPETQITIREEQKDDRLIVAFTGIDKYTFSADLATLNTDLHVLGDLQFDGAFFNGSELYQLPPAADTLCGLAAAQQLSNKTLMSPWIEGDATFVNRHLIKNMADPVDDYDAAHKQYVDSRISGLDFKASVISRGLNSPPLNPQPNDRYIVGTSPTGAWAGHPNGIAFWDADLGVWTFEAFFAGSATFVEAESTQVVYNGSEWVVFGATITHSALLGLSTDDHAQYALLAGRNGNQSLYGANILGGTLKLWGDKLETGSLYLNEGGAACTLVGTTPGWVPELHFEVGHPDSVSSARIGSFTIETSNDHHHQLSSYDALGSRTTLVDYNEIYTHYTHPVSDRFQLQTTNAVHAWLSDRVLLGLSTNGANAARVAIESGTSQLALYSAAAQTILFESATSTTLSLGSTVQGAVANAAVNNRVHSSGTLTFQVKGSEVAFLNQTRIGLFTTSPDTSLHLVGTYKQVDGAFSLTSDAAQRGIHMADATHNASFRTHGWSLNSAVDSFTSEVGPQSTLSASSDLAIFTNGRVVPSFVGSGGLHAINKASSLYALTVKAESNDTVLQLRSQSDLVTNEFSVTAAQSKWQFGSTRLDIGYTGQNQLTIVGATGRVGVGTTTPSQSLDVVGGIQVSGHLFTNGYEYSFPAPVGTATDELVTLTSNSTLTHKTLITPTIQTIWANDDSYDLPNLTGNGNDTLVSRTSEDTLQNKTLSNASISGYLYAPNGTTLRVAKIEVYDETQALFIQHRGIPGSIRLNTNDTVGINSTGPFAVHPDAVLQIDSNTNDDALAIGIPGGRTSTLISVCDATINYLQYQVSTLNPIVKEMRLGEYWSRLGTTWAWWLQDTNRIGVPSATTYQSVLHLNRHDHGVHAVINAYEPVLTVEDTLDCSIALVGAVGSNRSLLYPVAGGLQAAMTYHEATGFTFDIVGTTYLKVEAGSLTVTGTIHTDNHLTSAEWYTAYQHTLLTNNPHSTTLEQARTSGNTLNGNVVFTAGTISGLPLCTEDSQAASKLYVDITTQNLDLQNSVLTKSQMTPPVSPADGDRYLVPVGAGGAWAGHDDEIATYTIEGINQYWVYTAPRFGMTVFVVDELFQYAYDGTAWFKSRSWEFHSNLQGLLLDDHTQYALLAGRAGGQTWYGGTNASDSLVIQSNSAPDATSSIVMQLNGGAISVGTLYRDAKFQVHDATLNVKLWSNAGQTATLQLGTSQNQGSYASWIADDTTNLVSWYTMYDVEGKEVERFRLPYDSARAVSFQSPLGIGPHADFAALDSTDGIGLQVTNDWAISANKLWTDRLEKRDKANGDNFVELYGTVSQPNYLKSTAYSGLAWTNTLDESLISNAIWKAVMASDRTLVFHYADSANAGYEFFQLKNGKCAIGPTGERPTEALDLSTDNVSCWIRMNTVQSSGLKINTYPFVWAGLDDVAILRADQIKLFADPLAGSLSSPTILVQGSPYNAPYQTVGIHQANPRVNLDVKGTTRITSEMEAFATEGTRSGTSLTVADASMICEGDVVEVDGDTRSVVFRDGNTLTVNSAWPSVQYNTVNVYPHHFSVYNTVDMKPELLVNKDGYVAIGTSHAAYPLYVVRSDAGWTTAFENGDAYTYFNHRSGYGAIIHTGIASSALYALKVQNNSGTLLNVLNNGKVAINQTTPSYHLDVNCPNAGEGARIGVLFAGNYASSTNWCQVSHVNVAANNVSYALAQRNTGETYLNTPADQTLHIQQSAVDVMTVQANTGYIGINNTNPEARLHVTGDCIISGNLTAQGSLSYLATDDLTISDSLISMADKSTADTNDIGFYGKYKVGLTTLYAGLFRDSAQAERPFVVASDITTATSSNIAAGFQYAPFQAINVQCRDKDYTIRNKTSLTSTSSDYQVYSNNTLVHKTSVANTGKTTFYIGSGQNTTLRLTATGVGINTLADPTDTLEVNGSITCDTVTMVSDARVKQIHGPLDTMACADTVSKLQLVEYQHIPEYADQVHSQSSIRGLIAQQVAAVCPQLVQVQSKEVPGLGKVEDFHCIKQTELIMTLIGAIQDLQRQVRELQQNK